MIDLLIDRQELEAIRRQGGTLLKKRRKTLGLTQRQLASRVGLEAYTIVDQLERGIGRIAPYQYQRWADALELSIQTLVIAVLRHSDPVAFNLLVPNSGRTYC